MRIATLVVVVGVLLWIGSILNGILRNTAILSTQVAAAAHQGTEDQGMAQVMAQAIDEISEISSQLDGLTTVVAYWIAENDSGLYRESDISEINLDPLELGMLERARRVVKHLART